MPRLERGVAPARAGSDALQAAADIDGVVEAASPGWRERQDYQDRAGAIYGSPQIDVLHRVCAALQRRID